MGLILRVDDAREPVVAHDPGKIICKREINMRTVLAVAAIGLTSIGYLLGPAAALPRDCYNELGKCEGQLTAAGYSKSVVENVCVSRMKMCWAENERNGYGAFERPKEGNKEAKTKKPKEWRRPLPHVASPSKSGLTGSNAQLGLKTNSPTTAASTATGSAGNPTAGLQTSPPRPPTVSTQAIARERAARF